MIKYPTTHKDKLLAAINNNKVPESEVQCLKRAYEAYKKWISEIEKIYSKKLSSNEKVSLMIKGLNKYKNYIDVDLIFDSKNDFLYRQKGQMKLGSSIIEEFLPRLIHPSIVGKFNKKQIIVGPTKSLSNLQFKSNITGIYAGGGLSSKEKDQDFSISKKLFLKASHNEDYSDSIEIKTHLSFIAAECKTNLDKTMFQEALATASDLKKIVLGAKYFLICEWLDMQPIDTSVTNVDLVLILRKSKRMSSDIRKHFNKAAGRKKHRNIYLKQTNSNPIDVEVVMKFVTHIRNVIASQSIDEKKVLNRGFF